MTPLFQHRHYVKIASIIAGLPPQHRVAVAERFARELRGTNPNYSEDRFHAAALGVAQLGKDKAK